MYLKIVVNNSVGKRLDIFGWKERQFSDTFLSSSIDFFLNFLCFFVFFLWLHCGRHMEVPGPGLESELQLGPMPQPWQH